MHWTDILVLHPNNFIGLWLIAQSNVWYQIHLMELPVKAEPQDLVLYPIVCYSFPSNGTPGVHRTFPEDIR